MNKEAYLDSLLSKEGVNAKSEPTLESVNEFGDKRYRVLVRKVSQEGEVSYEHEYFVVLNEGEKDKGAAYKAA